MFDRRLLEHGLVDFRLSDVDDSVQLLHQVILLWPVVQALVCVHIVAERLDQGPKKERKSVCVHFEN